jgi:hypothetical protein
VRALDKRTHVLDKRTHVLKSVGEEETCGGEGCLHTPSGEEDACTCMLDQFYIQHARPPQVLNQNTHTSISIYIRECMVDRSIDRYRGAHGIHTTHALNHTLYTHHTTRTSNPHTIQPKQNPATHTLYPPIPSPTHPTTPTPCTRHTAHTTTYTPHARPIALLTDPHTHTQTHTRHIPVPGR